MNRIVPIFVLAAGLAVPGIGAAQTAPAPAPESAPTAAGQEAAPAGQTDAPRADTAPAAPDQAAASDNTAIDLSASAGEYVFDQEHSHIVWSYDHMGVSTSHGLVRAVSGSVVLDIENPQNSSVQAAFPLSSLQTVSAVLDEHMYGEDFFGGAAPATAVTFTSTNVEVTGPDTARVTGDLLLNGVTAPITLDVTMRQLGANPMTGDPGVGFDITGTLLRSDFGLGAFAPAVSDEVKLMIGVEAARS